MMVITKNNNFKNLVYTFLFVLSSLNHINSQRIERPNVILIMADDIGFEALGVNGSTSYNTPILDSLAKNGINFTKALSQPLCTPSRVKIMTGKFNYKNYDRFAYLNSNQKTFGNLFKENGYKTAIVGKWQLNGIHYKDLNEISKDRSRPNKFGFDEYSLWQLDKLKIHGERFANPLIVENGKELPRNKDAYGPDIVSDYAVDFIKRNKENKFFLYYPMLLVHDPFVPTPDSPEWDLIETRSEKNNRFFVDMVAYMDKIVGKIMNELNEQGIADKTLVLFVGDNGTNSKLISQTISGPVRGGKANTITHGVNVPMVAYWPSTIQNSRTYHGLVNFNDFYATFSDILNVSDDSDGKSMMDIFTKEKQLKRDIVTIYYDSKWGKNKYRNVFSQNKRYKLYKNGNFFDMEKDILERSPLLENELSKDQKLIKKMLASDLSNFPDVPLLKK